MKKLTLEAFTVRRSDRAVLPLRLLLARILPVICAAGLIVAGGAPASTAPATPASSTDHLAYFGFYASAMGHWNFTEELAPSTNLTWVRVGSPATFDSDARQIVERVSEARTAGVQAVVDLEFLLFADEKGTPRHAAEIEEVLVDLRARLELEGLLESVVMFYPKDEPFREFRRARDPDFIEEYITGDVYRDIESDLETVNALVKAVFPDHPVGVILSGLELDHRFFSIPESYDWVGFNCYANLFDACNGRSFYQLYGRLLAKMTPEQRLIAVPEAWVTHEEAGLADFPVILGQRLRLHYEMALSEPRFIAFIPFLWSFEAPEAVPGMGLDRFPELYDRGDYTPGSDFMNELLAMGKSIKAGTTIYPNLSWSETEADSRPGGIIYGELAPFGADGMLRGVVIDQALPHKNLRYRLVVETPSGTLLHKTRMKRTDQPVSMVVPDSPEDGLLMGTHGFAVSLPEALWKSHSGKDIRVTLISYADGPGATRAHQHELTFSLERTEATEATGSESRVRVKGPGKFTPTPALYHFP